MNKNDKIIIDISTSTLVRAIALVLLVWFIFLLRDVVSVLLFSVVIASSIEPAAHWFARYKIPRLLGVLAIFVLAFALLGLVFYLVIPPLLGEVTDFIFQLPQYLNTQLEPKSLLSFLPQLPTGFSDILKDYLISIETSVSNSAGELFRTGAAVFGGALSFILIIVISFYLSVQEHGIENFLRIITPQEYEGYVLDLWSRTRRKLGLWLQGQFLLGILVGILVFLGLTILGVKFALLLAILAAIFEIIPVFGPVLAGIPAVGIAFLQKPVLGLSVLILFVIVQQFENHLIYPLVVRKTIGVPPLLVVLAIVIGGTLGGIFGILLSVPIATALMEFIQDIARRKEIVL